MKKHQNKVSLTFFQRFKIFGKETIAVFRVLPLGVYIFFLGVAIGVGAYAAFSFFGNEKPQAQILLDRDAYSLAYDGHTKNPAWVLQILTQESIQKNNQTPTLTPDPDLPEFIRTSPESYKNTLFVPGQLLTYPCVVNTQCAYLSTCSPMNKTFHDLYWNQVMDHTQKLVKKLGKFKILVITGPLFLSDQTNSTVVKYQLIGNKQIAVPTHFFKVVFPTPDESDAIVLIVPNREIDKNTPIDSFKSSLKDLEKRSGIVFPKNLQSYFVVPLPHM